MATQEREPSVIRKAKKSSWQYFLDTDYQDDWTPIVYENLLNTFKDWNKFEANKYYAFIAPKWTPSKDWKHTDTWLKEWEPYRIYWPDYTKDTKLYVKNLRTGEKREYDKNISLYDTEEADNYNNALNILDSYTKNVHKAQELYNKWKKDEAISLLWSGGYMNSLFTKDDYLHYRWVPTARRFNLKNKRKFI